MSVDDGNSSLIPVVARRNNSLGDLKEGRAEVELAVCGDSLVS
jgi:hypothetical protein